MNTKRIEEIQNETAYPDSISVQQALLKVWNEVEQEKMRKEIQLKVNKQEIKNIITNGIDRIKYSLIPSFDIDNDEYGISFDMKLDIMVNSIIESILRHSRK